MSFFAILIIGCKKDQVEPAITYAKSFSPAEYEDEILSAVDQLTYGEWGEEHNRILDELYLRLEESKIQPNEGIEWIYNTMVNDLGYDLHFNGDGDLLVEFVDMSINRHSFDSHRWGDALSDSDKAAIIQLQTILRRDDIQTIVNELIEYENIHMNSGITSEVVEGFLDIAKASLIYWTHNFVKWGVALDPDFQYPGQKQTWDEAGTRWFWQTMGGMAESDANGLLRPTPGGLFRLTPRVAATASGINGLYQVFFGERCPPESNPEENGDNGWDEEENGGTGSTGGDDGGGSWTGGGGNGGGAGGGYAGGCGCTFDVSHNVIEITCPCWPV